MYVWLIIVAKIIIVIIKIVFYIYIKIIGVLFLTFNMGAF